MVGFFLAGFPIAEVAIIGGAFLLFTRRVKPEKVYCEIDWPLLVMFAGLFIVVAGFEKAVIGPEVHRSVADLDLGDVRSCAGFTAVLSNLVSNVPAVLVLEPFVATPRRSAARLARRGDGVDARRQLHPRRLGRQPDRGTTGAGGGVTISFWAHFRVGAPMTLLSLAFGVWWLS